MTEYNDLQVQREDDERRQLPRYIAVAASEYDSEDGDVPAHALALVFHSMRHGAGQTEALLAKSGLVELANGNVHHPFLVFQMQPHWHRVRITPVRDARDVAKYPPDTAVLAQWPGRYRSDWFMMTAGDVADFLKRRDETLAEME